MSADPNDIHFDLSDDDTDALFDTPGKPRPKANDANGTPTETAAPAAARQRSQSRQSAGEAREAALQRELDNVRGVNKVIEGVVESLEKAKDNMGTVSRTVTQATTLLHTWSRILSQTEHNQRLILNPTWQGATQDVADMETQALQRQQAEQRREVEERHRREAAARKAEEEERRRTAESTRGTSRSTRGRKTVTRAGSTAGSGTTTGYTGVGGQGGRGSRTTGTTRSSSGIGRGTRGRGRGVG